MSNPNRAKGHRLELKWVNIFKEWFPKARSSRQASRLLDDCQVDLAFIPYNVQCKKGYPKGINYSKIFADMKQLLADNFPDFDSQLEHPKIIIHDKGRKAEEKLVIMQEHDFLELLKQIHNDKIK